MDMFYQRFFRSLKTDKIVEKVLVKLMEDIPEELLSNYKDNIRWIHDADQNGLVEGSYARILYADA